MKGITLDGGSGWRCTYYFFAAGGFAVGCSNELMRDELREALELCAALGHDAKEHDDGTLSCRRCGDRLALEPDEDFGTASDVAHQTVARERRRPSW